MRRCGSLWVGDSAVVSGQWSVNVRGIGVALICTCSEMFCGCQGLKAGDAQAGFQQFGGCCSLRSVKGAAVDPDP